MGARNRSKTVEKYLDAMRSVSSLLTFDNSEVCREFRMNAGFAGELKNMGLVKRVGTCTYTWIGATPTMEMAQDYAARQKVKSDAARKVSIQKAVDLQREEGRGVEQKEQSEMESAWVTDRIEGIKGDIRTTIEDVRHETADIIRRRQLEKEEGVKRWELSPMETFGRASGLIKENVAPAPIPVKRSEYKHHTPRPEREGTKGAPFDEYCPPVPKFSPDAIDPAYWEKDQPRKTVRELLNEISERQTVLRGPLTPTGIESVKSKATYLAGRYGIDPSRLDEFVADIQKLIEEL